MTSPEYLILADDLSGALNIGVEFADYGLETRLMTGMLVSSTNIPEVLVINTETRNLQPSEAVQTVQQTARMLQTTAPHFVVKKIDSLLRGHIGQEIEAVMQAFNFSHCLLVAASPAIGRRTVGGYHLVDDMLLTRQRQKLDPSSRVSTSYIPELLAQQTTLPVSHISMAAIESGEPVALRPGIIVADAMQQADMNAVVGAAVQAGIRCFAGTYGLGKALLSGSIAPVLVVAGSMSGVTHHQLDALSRRLDVLQVQIAYPHAFFEAPDAAFAALVEDTARLYREQLEQGEQSVILRVDAPQEMTQAYDAAFAAKRIDALVTAVVGLVLGSYAGVIATGGATASAVLQAMAGDGLTFAPLEVVPGIPLTVVDGGPYDGLPFIAKPGAQGADDVLVQLVYAIDKFRRRNGG